MKADRDTAQSRIGMSNFFMNTRELNYHIVIVTHNSQDSITLCLESILSQTVSDYMITIVDSGSREREYLQKIHGDKVRILYESNIGFSRANNLAAKDFIDTIPYTIFVNPDVVLPGEFLSDIGDYLKINKEIGILGPKLLRYDLEKNRESDIIDSTGIFQKWYGRWYDRGQGEIDHQQYDDNYLMPEAICGALMVCSSDAIKRVQISQNEFFRNNFFMYKEDIELSIRTKAGGYPIHYNPKIIAFHCRGWKTRNEMSYLSKHFSAKNELFINRKRGPVKFLFSLCKLIFVELQSVMGRK
ncbi:MAG: glycosyltransferase family 2 protein [Bacteroidota bacterium]